MYARLDKILRTEKIRAQVERFTARTTKVPVDIKASLIKQWNEMKRVTKHFTSMLQGSHLLLLCIVLALVANIMIAQRLSSISFHLNSLEHHSPPPAHAKLVADSLRHRYGFDDVDWLATNVDSILRKMSELQDTVRDQSERLYRSHTE